MKISPKSNLKLLKELGNFASKENIEIYAVGGCVRDWILNIKNNDLDIAVSGKQEKVEGFLKRKYKAKIEKFGEFLTARCFFQNGLRLDIANFRKESYKKPAALPFAKKARTLKEDLKRRDFSANALALNLSEKFLEPIDFYNGLKDIKRGKVRILHKKSFVDDPTRIFRAAKFCARFGWKMEWKSLALLKKAVKNEVPSLLSRDRVKNEISRILEEAEPLKTFQILEKWKALKFIHPDFKIFRIPKFKNIEMKFVFMACKMANPACFAASLNADRRLSVLINRIAKIQISGRSPVNSLSKSEKLILKALNPKVKKTALKKLFINGRDIEKRGIESGKKFGKILNAAAALQWRGKLKNRKEALKWLKQRVSKK